MQHLKEMGVLCSGMFGRIPEVGLHPGETQLLNGKLSALFVYCN